MSEQWPKGWKPSEPPTLLDRVWKGTKGDEHLTPPLSAALAWLIEESRRRAAVEDAERSDKS